MQKLNYNDGRMFIYNQKNSYMHFGTNGGEKMRIAADGKVGIGQTNFLTNLT